MVGSLTQERRKTARRRVLRGARITFKGTATITCVVRSLSDGGACLNVSSPIGIPDAFDLVVVTDPVRHCQMVWRKVAQVGIAFV
jgi:hypothetical protein